MERTKIDWNRTDLVFCLIAAFFLYFHLFVLPATPIFYEEDHLYFIQDAWRMYQGESLYKDFFEYTFPGTQVVYLFLLEFFGTKFWVINAVIFLQGFTISLICVAIGKHLFGKSWNAYLPAALFLFLGFRWFGIDGSHRMLSPIFFLLAILVLLPAYDRKRLIIAGVFCALSSYFTQQRGFLVLGAIGLFVIIESLKNRVGIKKWFFDELALSLSFLAALFLLILPFVMSAGAGTFFEYTIVYIRYYVQDPTANYGAYGIVFQRVLEQGAVIAAIMFFYYALIPFVYLACFIYLWRRQYASSALLITLVGASLAIGTFAPTPSRLFQISMPGLIVFVWLSSRIRFMNERIVKAAVLALVLLGAIVTLRLQTSWEKLYLDAPTGRIAFLSSVTLERYKWLSENTVPGEYVFEVYQCAVNFPLQLPNPTQLTFLLDNGYTPQWQVDRAIGNLKEKNPRFIIWDGRWNKERDEREPGDHLAPLYDYLRERYILEKEFTPYSKREMQVWKLKN
jgi:hypothetical protein